MTQGCRLSWPLAALLLQSGCAVLSCSAPIVSDVPGNPARGLVFAVDGAGGFEAASRSVQQTVAADHLPLDVRCYHWTHGYCRILADEVHAAHQRRQARKLAALILSCRQECPNRPISLVGHSAGCGLALLVAESLPPNTLDRIVMLAPAVSVRRDLRAVLASTCRGVDVFYSKDDWICLGLFVLFTGTTDHCWTRAAAGKVGFQPTIESPEDAALYAKLHQYPWDESLKWTGHKGGHYGAYQPGYLRAFVLPLLLPPG